ncbi:MAG TPA: response regulator [Vicinamibacteria bacterium]|nr:response regulator [Vicinamibacteria bacterium]
MGTVLRLDGIRVLIVEDDEDTRDVLTLGLELQGAEVCGVGSAKEAFGAVDQFSPDVILSDIGLPDEDGLSLIRRLRQLPADSGRIPAAAVTAFTLGDDGQEPIRAGFQRHFRKPVETRELFEAVAELARLGAVERRARSRRDADSTEQDHRV